MEISTRHEKFFLILRISGRMDDSSMSEFDRQCDALIHAGNRQFIVNLSGVEYISSEGLRSLLSASNKLKSVGGTLVLCSLTSTLKEILAIAGLERLIPVFADETTASCSGIKPPAAETGEPSARPAGKTGSSIIIQGPESTYPEERTVPALFEEEAALYPDRPAVVFHDETLTYRELNQRANCLAHAIRHYYRQLYGSEMTSDTRIGLCLTRHPGLIVAMLGILKAGGAYIPLDPDYPEDRLCYIMDDAKSQLIITEQALLEKLLFLNKGEYGIISLDGGWEVIAQQSTDNPIPVCEARSLACVMFTSGTTGRPKGVMVEHRCIVNLSRHQKFLQVTAADCVAQTASICFDVATAEIWIPLLNSARVAILDRNLLLSPSQLGTAHLQYGVTIQFFTTAVFNLLAEGNAEGLVELKSAIFGGEEANAARVRHVLRVKKNGLTVINAYGPTECTTLCAFLALSAETHIPDARSIPIGGPLERTQLYVLDEKLQPVPEGTPGELFVSGDGVARGYLNHPEWTAERFIENPFATIADRQRGKYLRLYKTGDLVRRLPGDILEYIGRVDSQVRIRGFRVELGEIESALATHPGVKECVVTTFGEGGQKQLVAYFIPSHPDPTPAAQLRRHLAQIVPYYMVPSVFMRMEGFPLDANGKVDRRALPPPVFRKETVGLDVEACEPSVKQTLARASHGRRVEYSREHTLVELFEERVRCRADEIAIVHNDKTLTFAALNARANRLAHRLRQIHQDLFHSPFKPGTAVGLCVERDFDMVAGILGILKAGGAYVPLSADYPEQRWRVMLEDTGIHIILTQTPIRDRLPWLAQEGLTVVCLDREKDPSALAENPVRLNQATDTAYIIYTSGSTGTPKGVCVSHQAVHNFLLSAPDLSYSAGDVIAQCASYCFDASTFEIWGALLVSSHLVIVDHDQVLNPELLLATMERHNITTAFFTTALFDALTESRMEVLTRLKCVMFGGERASVPCVQKVLAQKPSSLTLINVYGPTECTTYSTFYVLSDKDRHCDILPIGRPLWNYTAYVLDENFQQVPLGAPGELYIGGDSLSTGYLNRPELTKERFISNPFAAETERQAGFNQRLYKTGDLVRLLPDGNIDILGRADFQVKIRGFRIEPEEVESALATHPGVAECVVTAFGEGEQKQLVAYFIPSHPDPTPAAQLRQHLGQLVPYYMMPSVFMPMQRFPLNANGKVDRRALPPPVFRKETVGLGETSAETKRAPQNEMERALFEIVASALNAPYMGMDDNFFQLGAHSLIAAHIAATIRNRLHLLTETKDVFEHPTIADLAELISQRAAGGAVELATIPVASRHEPIPLTFQQEQIWFLSKLAPDLRAYNCQWSIRLAGELDKAVLERCLSEIIRRHEILRTTFHEEGGAPIQVIHSPWKATIIERDLRSLPAEQREAESERLIGEELGIPFSFSVLPLVRWRLYRLGDADWVLLQVEHHFVHDGWEVGLFLKEFEALYTAFLAGEESPLEPLPIQYADFAVWQRKTLCGEKLKAKVRYWIEKVGDYPHVLNLCTDHPRPPLQSFNGNVCRFNLDWNLYHALRQFSLAHQVTLFMTMYAAFAVLLSRHTQQKQLLIGTGVANRTMKETEGLLGMFVNTVLLHTDLTGNPTFAEFLTKTREDMLADSQHYDTPFASLVERLKTVKAPGRNPVFQVLFAFHDSAVPLLDFAGLKGHLLERHNQTAKMDMNVICIPRAEQHVTLRETNLAEEELTVMWEYNSDLFERETIQRFVEEYVTLLKNILSSPDRRISELDLIPAGEKQTLARASHGRRVEYSREHTLVELFEERVRCRADEIAIVHNDKTLTFAALNARANRLAHRLRQIHQDLFHSPFKPGTAVGLCVERDFDMVAGILGILKAGGAYVPLSADYPEQRWRVMLEDTGIHIILTQTPIRDRLPWLAQEGLTVVCLDREKDPSALAENPVRLNQATDTAYIIYTSGSTGTPKGVCVSHQAVHNFLLSAPDLSYSAGDVIAQCASYCFDASTFEIWGALLVSSHLVIVDHDQVLNPELLLATMERHNITTAFFTTALFDALTESRMEVLTRLKCVMFGGERASVPCVQKVLAQKPSSLTLINVYGPTECTTYSTFYVLSDKDRHCDILPIGRPLWNYTAYVLDENFQQVPLGAPGELYIGGDSLSTGYLNRPELTKERFISNPFAAETERQAGFNQRLYKTGDLVRLLPDGNIDILGRADFQVKIRGFRIEPEEVEKVFVNHPNVKQCVVIPWGQHLVAYWEPKADSIQTVSDDLKGFLARQLPDYMLPSIFIRVEHFEINSNGKIDRIKLPTPTLDELSIHGEYVAPQTETEKNLADIWKTLLGVARVGIHDSFFDLGGTSILTVRMLAMVRQKLGAEINVARLFSQPTIAALASFMEGKFPSESGEEDNLALALRDAQTNLSINVSPPPGLLKDPAHVLLTGVTGFLGFYLLDKLLTLTSAKVYCLIRGKDDPDVRRRFHKTLRFYRRSDLNDHPRIILLKADLGEPSLGLAAAIREQLQQNLDQIYHSGAHVHHLYDYRTLRAENVLGTVELLKIAANGRRKGFQYVSAISAASIRDSEGYLVEVEPGDRPISINGYNISKWVSEQIVHRAAALGIPANIFRPGNITGDSRSGLCPPDKNHFLLLLKGFLQMKTAPAWKRAVEMTPVDILAEGIVRLSLENLGSHVFNLHNPHQITWVEYLTRVKALGFDLQIIDAQQWRDEYLSRVNEDNALFPFKELYLKQREDLLKTEPPLIPANNAGAIQETLRRLGVFYPSSYDQHLAQVINYLRTTGFLSG